MNDILIYTIPDGDWQALYFNGQLYLEQHQIRISDLKSFCPIRSIKTAYLKTFDVDEDSFPELEKHIPKEWLYNE